MEKHYLEAGADQTGYGTSWFWDLQESGPGMWQAPLPSLPVSCASLFLQPPLWKLLPALNEQLITLEGEINWSESCLGWLSSGLCGLAAISSKRSDYVSSPPAPPMPHNSLLDPGCYFLLSLCLSKAVWAVITAVKN